MSKKKSEKKVKNQDYGQNKLFLSTMSCTPWALSATWLHVEAPLKNWKSELNTHFQQKFATGSYGVGI
jgi:hypothetical protein